MPLLHALYEKVVIRIKEIGLTHTLIDIAYAMCNNMMSYTGTAIIFGTGASKKKLNTKSSMLIDLLRLGLLVLETSYLLLFRNIHWDKISFFRAKI